MFILNYHGKLFKSAERFGFMFILLLVEISTMGQEIIHSTNDGPFVSYIADSIVVKTILTKRGVRQVETKMYPISQKQHINLPIRFSNQSNWNFDVKLRPEITNEKPVWEQPSKLLALSDIEGQFEGFRNLLLANQVIDKKYNWTFGNGHVVLCGDMFDRGLYVTEELWLLYKLEQDAKANGGYFHTVLGNHDIMNLSGDLRYLQPKYLENAKLMNVDYMKLYGADTELGRWLRSKNIIEQIGENLCTHGGISSKLNQMQLSLAEINNRARPFYDQAETDEVYANEMIRPFFEDTTSPFWYRGYFVKPRATQNQVDSTLAIFNCNTIIIGHTIAPRNIAAYYQNKVIAVDVNHHEGKHEGALHENGTWYIINTSGKRQKLFDKK